MKSGYAFQLVQELFARTYSLTTGNEPYPLRRLLAEDLERVEARNVLDVGCGSGNYALADKGYIGIDTNPGYINFCLKRRPGEFHRMSATNMEFVDGTFDAAICFSVGHHIPDEVIHCALNEIARVLKPGGWLFFADTVRPITALPFVSRILERLDEGDSFRTEQQYDLLLQRRFRIAQKQNLVDQFYRTTYFSCQKR